MKAKRLKVQSDALKKQLTPILLEWWGKYKSTGKVLGEASARSRFKELGVALELAMDGELDLDMHVARGCDCCKLQVTELERAKEAAVAGEVRFARSAASAWPFVCSGACMSSARHCLLPAADARTPSPAFAGLTSTVLVVCLASHDIITCALTGVPCVDASPGSSCALLGKQVNGRPTRARQADARRVVAHLARGDRGAFRSRAVEPSRHRTVGTR